MAPPEKHRAILRAQGHLFRLSRSRPVIFVHHLLKKDDPVGRLVLTFLPVATEGGILR